MSKGTICSNCQDSLPENSKFCSRCGTKYIKPKHVSETKPQPSQSYNKNSSVANDNIKLIAGIIVGLLLGYIFASAFTGETIIVDNTVDSNELENLVNSLELELKSANNLNNEYKTDNELLEQQIKEYGDLQAILLDVNSELESIKSEKTKLEAEVARNLNDISRLQNLNAELNSRPPASNNQRELDELKSKIEILENQQENLESTKSNLENEISVLNSQITTLNTKIATIEDKNANLEESNEELKKKLDEATDTSLENYSEVKYIADILKTKVVMVYSCWEHETLASLSPVSGKRIVAEDKNWICFTKAGSVGSGYFISANGCLLTNAHVVAGNYEHIVELYNGDFKKAYLLKVEENNNLDFALLRVNNINTPYVKFGNSHPHTGSQIVSVGHPQHLGWWVKSAGNFNSRSETGGYWFDLAVRQGASGSPIVNMDNELIGMVKEGLGIDTAVFPMMPDSNIIVSKYNFGIERAKRSFILADNIFDIKAFVYGTTCDP